MDSRESLTALVVYDTTYGNTKIIANTVAAHLGDHATARFVNDMAPKP